MKLWNFFADKNQENAAISGGRSMVEMLGVLSIIGVLSVGAIAGYSKAMMKYKMNKQAEQVSAIINTGLRYSKQWNFSQNTQMMPYFIKLGEIPKEMIKNGENNYVYDVFGIPISTLYTITGTEPCSQLFFLLDTSKNDEYGLSICRNLLLIAKEFHAHLYFVSMISGTTDAYSSQAYYGDQNCTGSKVCIKDITMVQIEDICRYNLGKTETPHLKIVWKE